MNVYLSKASDYRYEGSVQLDTMADLLAFIKENGQVIVEEHNPDIYGKGYDLHITIYDDYVE